jgi:hypothetical protein
MALKRILVIEVNQSGVVNFDGVAKALGRWLAMHRTFLRTFRDSDGAYRRRKAIHRHRFSRLAREAAT